MFSPCSAKRRASDEDLPVFLCQKFQEMSTKSVLNLVCTGSATIHQPNRQLQRPTSYD